MGSFRLGRGYLHELVAVEPHVPRTLGGPDALR